MIILKLIAFLFMAVSSTNLINTNVLKNHKKAIHPAASVQDLPSKNPLQIMMNLSSIELKHSNPSLGPHEKIKTIRLQVNEDTKNRVEKFLEQSTINGIVGMREFLEAYRSNDEATLKKVFSACTKDTELNEGESISDLTFNFKDDESLEISDVYRTYSITHFYKDFTRYMLENGTVMEGEDDLDRPKPRN